MMSGIERVKRMLGNMPANEWSGALESVLTSPDVVEIPGYPRIDPASFVLARAKSRQANTQKLKLKTFGLASLITELEALPADTPLQNYGIKTGAYTGSCFVLDEKLLGCEFVERGTAKTIPFSG
ncbi:hypothetical protein C7H84_12555 [Burkholderia sp. Nafp2/4-1b]|uniref:hypothetical protein n=1 Tax=Burkholderia sp. Nafp2/4-1b TaxID=2116686 RepID=UPI000F25C628|nr:hypothetical protein [Burkholderia sp. Nafp2/4-1b]RKU03029.1 hypothetical protein C7H84_12555 [Burkholderia sp. Nafp2/4-1b]